jgi:hypothetical protein
MVPSEPPSYGRTAKLWLRGVGALFVLASIVELAFGWVPYGLQTLYWGAVVASWADLDTRNMVMFKHADSLDKKSSPNKT